MKRLVTMLLVAAFFMVSAAEMDAASGGRRRASNNFEEIEGVITALSRDQVTIRCRRGDRPVRLTSSTIVTVDGQRAGAGFLQVGARIPRHRPGMGAARELPRPSHTPTLARDDISEQRTRQAVHEKERAADSAALALPATNDLTLDSVA